MNTRTLRIMCIRNSETVWTLVLNDKSNVSKSMYCTVKLVWENCETHSRCVQYIKSTLFAKTALQLQLLRIMVWAVQSA